MNTLRPDLDIMDDHRFSEWRIGGRDDGWVQSDAPVSLWAWFLSIFIR